MLWYRYSLWHIYDSIFYAKIKNKHRVTKFALARNDYFILQFKKKEGSTMKKFILSVLSIGCMCCMMMHINSVYALNAPDCAAGSCQDAQWNIYENFYEDCPHGGGLDANGQQMTCTCYANSDGDYKWLEYECACMSDEDCNRGSTQGYCSGGKCKPCESSESSCATGTVTEPVDDCNFTTTTTSWSCQGGCLNQTTSGCYTGGTDGPGTYTCQ